MDNHHTPLKEIPSSSSSSPSPISSKIFNETVIKGKSDISFPQVLISVAIETVNEKANFIKATEISGFQVICCDFMKKSLTLLCNVTPEALEETAERIHIEEFDGAEPDRKRLLLVHEAINLVQNRPLFKYEK